VRLTKEFYGFDPDKSFFIPDAAAEDFRAAVPKGEELVAKWQERLQAYRSAFPDLAAELERRTARELPEDWASKLPTFADGSEAMATRNASQAVMQSLIEPLPELF